MKKLILVFQILVFTWTQLSYAADGTSTPNPVKIEQTSEEQKADLATQMPANYKLPDMHLLDSSKFINKYKDKQGQRLNVEGYSGRFGATFGEEFKQKIFEIEKASNEKLEIILTLTSTMEDAKILKQRMALVGRKMMIVELPDEVQARMLARANTQAAGGFKELWFDTKDTAQKFAHPAKTLNNSAKIFKNQFVKPTQRDFSMAMVSIGSTVTTTAACLLVGVDPMLAISIMAARLVIGVPNLYFYKTINNFFKSDITDEMNVTSSLRQMLMKFFVLGFGIGEAYYEVGAAAAGASYKYTQGQLITNMFTSGLIDTAGTVERDKRLSEQATYQMIVYSIMIGAALNVMATVGLTGPMVIESGHFQITALQVGTIGVYSGLFIAYKFLTNHVEKVAQRDLVKLALNKYRRVLNIRSMHDERVEREDAIKKAARDSYFNRARDQAIGATCSRLFQ